MKTAKELKHRIIDEPSKPVRRRLMQTFCDQLCKEQSAKCADIYLKERCNNLESSVESIAESIRNAPQPTTAGE